MNILRNRKVLGTILGTILFISCLMYFTYAYYVWQSESKVINISITDNGGKSTCDMGPDIDVVNIGPVLDYNDGVWANFNVNNKTNSDNTIDVILNISSISNSLQNETFKYKLFKDGSVIASGDFENFVEDTDNVIAEDILIEIGVDYDFDFVVYIDGSIYNENSMQSSKLNSTLKVGNCIG